MGNYFYEDEEKEKLKEKFLTNEARKWAKSFINPKFPTDRRDRNPRLSSAQLRRFHMEAKTLEARVEVLEKPNEEFLKLRPIVKMLKSKVAYACPIPAKDKKSKKVPEEFRRYIEEMVDNIDDYKDFKAFCLCFEAVVGFFYGEGGRQR